MSLKISLYVILLTFFALFKTPSFAQSSTNNSPIILAYFPSWSENWTSANQNSKLREIPSYVNYVFLAFAKPDLTYVRGSYDISQTGIQVPYNGCTLKESIGALSNKGIKVILSIGGETYWTSNSIYSNINYQQIKDLVDDMGFAGIDWDFEPNGSFANIGSPTNVQHFIDFFVQSRLVMPRSQGYIMACAPSGVGALGGQNNDDSSSPFAFANRNTLTGETDAQLYQGAAQTNGINLFGFSATGHMIPVIKAIGNEIDLIAYQGYNAGGSTNRSIMYDAYAHYAKQYGFKIAAGIHYPNEPWGPYYTYNHTNVAALSDHIKTHPDRIGSGDGIMIWQLLMAGNNSSAFSYLNVASSVLNGATQAAAISGANNFSMQPYSGGANDCNGNTGGGGTGGGGTGGGTGGSGTTYCGHAPYDNSLAYPTPNTNVYHQCKIWKNLWYANPNEVPGSNSVRVEISVCTEDSSCTGNGNTGSGGTGGGGTGGGTGGSGTTYCGHAPYDNSLAYPTPNTNVYHQCKIWKNLWYANPNEVPGSNSVWVEISVCTEDSTCTGNGNTGGGGTGGGTGGNGTTYCGHAPYDNSLAYPAPNTNVYHQCKIWNNLWYANPNEAPGSNNVWVEVGPCNDDPNCVTALVNRPQWSINNQLLSIKNIIGQQTIYIFDALGRLHDTQVTSSDITIDLNKLSMGTYWISVIDAHGNRSLTTMVKIR